MDGFNAICLALVLFNASAVIGLLFQGLFIFNLSDGIPLGSPVLTAIDISVQMFLSVLQLVCGSMLWKLRKSSQDPLILFGLQRACCVIMCVQLLVFGIFGVASELVLRSEAFVVTVAGFSFVIGLLLLSVWRTDILSSRGTMLRAALKVDAAALSVVICYTLLHLHQDLDAKSSLSVAFSAAVSQNRWLLLVSLVCVGLLLFVMFLWASSRASKVGLCPLEDEHARKIQFLNVVCAGVGLFGGSRNWGETKRFFSLIFF
jgi:hypothetical protein